MQGLRLLLTTLAVTAPDGLIMQAMGWTTLSHVALIGAWTVIASVLLILSTGRHRRREWRRSFALPVLVLWLALGAAILAIDWQSRAVVLALLLLPSAGYLLVEAVGLTPKPRVPGPLN